jgi:hypothetical protein
VDAKTAATTTAATATTGDDEFFVSFSFGMLLGDARGV